MSEKKPTRRSAGRKAAESTPSNETPAKREPASTLNLHERLLGIVQDLAGGPEKGGKASEKIGGWSFHRADDVESAIAGLLVRWGVMTYVTVDDEQTDWRTDMYPDDQGNPRGGFLARVLVRIVFVNVDSPDDRFGVQGPGLGVDRGDKATAKAVTYATKGLWIRLFHLSGSPDNEADEAPESTVPGEVAAQDNPRAIDDPTWPFPITREHKDKPIGAVPISTLRWVLDTAKNIQPELRLRCSAEVERRETAQPDAADDVPEIQLDDGVTVEDPIDYGAPTEGASTGGPRRLGQNPFPEGGTQ